jgi:hypothetical protein
MNYDTSVPSMWMLALGGLVVFHLLSVLRSYWRLRHIPGPWLAAVSELWYIRAATSGELHLRLAEVCSKYGTYERRRSAQLDQSLHCLSGGTARIGPNTVITCSENFIRKSNEARGTYRRGFWFSAFKFDADYENVFSERNEEKHTAMRAKLAAGVQSPYFPGSIDADLLPSILVKTIPTSNQALTGLFGI